MSVIYITKENAKKEVLLSEGVRLLDFYADWCNPCRVLSPLIDEFSEEHPEYSIAKINVDELPSIAQKFNVMSIPTLILLKDGNILSRLSGHISKSDIINMVNEFR